MTFLSLHNINGGDISSLLNLTNLATLICVQDSGFPNKITGDVSSLTIGDFFASGTNVYGDFTSLVANCTSDGLVVLRTSNATDELTVDLSQASQSFNFANINGEPYQDFKATWTTTRNSSYPIISIDSGYNTEFGRIHFIDFGDDLDAMLKNQAQCSTTGTASTKVINVKGNHDTSDADAVAAIATLKAVGYTIRINGIIQ